MQNNGFVLKLFMDFMDFKKVCVSVIGKVLYSIFIAFIKPNKLVGLIRICMHNVSNT
jgi:hypothetical protein